MHELDDGEEALLALSGRLVREGYRFVTTTPETHQRVLARRAGRMAASLTDVFGWSMAFAPGLLQCDLRDELRQAGMLDEGAAVHRSRVRLSTVRAHAFLHSAFPTSGVDAVFLGPDSYRFANLIADELEASAPAPDARIVDVGVGAGVGAVVAATFCSSAMIVGTDVNPLALRLARVNAAAAGLAIQTIETSGLDGVSGLFDLVLLNPPYLMDDDARSYRDGGAMHGGQLPLDLATAGLGRLAPGGRLIFYSGSAIVNGVDALKAELARSAAEHGCAMCYREIDPDVFGEELDSPRYAEVDRIALVSAIFTRPR